MSERIQLSISRGRAIGALACIVAASVFFFAAGLASGLLWASLYAGGAVAVPVVAKTQPSATIPAVAAEDAELTAPENEDDQALGGAALLPARIITLSAAPPESPRPPALPPASQASSTTPSSETGTPLTAKPDMVAARSVGPGDTSSEGVPLAIRVCSFTGKTSAQEMADDLDSLGYHARLVRAKGVGGQDWYVVKVGPYTTWNAASTVAAHIASAERVRPVVEPMP
jgi:cell division protein FtsN